MTRSFREIPVGILVAELFVYVLLVPFMIFSVQWIIKAQSLKHELFFQKRNPRISLIQSLAIIVMMIGFCFSTFSNLHNSIAAQVPAALLVTIGLWTFIWCLLTKSWLTFFTIKWTISTHQSEWQQLINANNAESNWYIRNHHKYGNHKYIEKAFGIGCVIAYFVCYHAIFLSWSGIELIQELAILINLVVKVSVTAFYVRTVLKTPSFDDSLFIYSEFRITSRILGLLIFTMIFHSVLYGLVFSKKENVVHALYVSQSLTANACLFAMIWISTYYVMKKNGITNNVETLLLQHSAIGSSSGTPSSSTSKPERITLQMVLENEHGVRLFMAHLSKKLTFLLLCTCLCGLELMIFVDF